MIAKAFTNKIIELGLPLRRERKSTASEAKEGNNEEVPEVTKADMVINLVDFPLNQEELDDFSKLRNPLNKLFVIREKKPQDFDILLEESHKPKPVKTEGEGDEPVDEKGEEDVEEVKLIENEERDKTDHFIRSYDFKAFKAPKNSIFKISDLRVFHYEHVIEEPKENADENSPDPRNSVNELKERFSEGIISTEQKIVKF